MLLGKLIEESKETEKNEDDFETKDQEKLNEKD